MSEHIFVYGTLRSESTHPMAARLRTGAKLVGKGKTAGLLYDLGAYPGAVFASGERRHVIGEVFRFGANAKLLAELDSYEGITGAKDDMWARVLVEVGLDHGGSVEAWAYGLTAVPRARVIGTGDFIADRRLGRGKPQLLNPFPRLAFCVKVRRPLKQRTDHGSHDNKNRGRDRDGAEMGLQLRRRPCRRLGHGA